MIFKRKKTIDPSRRIVVVSGLPRSGTSMMMKMLDAAGIPPLTDEERTADEDNPKGYFEFERVKKLRDGDYAWLPRARGKAVKVIAFLLEFLPAEYEYEVIFMRRAMPEILASQRKMLVNRGEDPDKVSDAEMSRMFDDHLTQMITWARRQKNIRYIEIDYNEMLSDPRPQCEALADFLGEDVDAEKMIGVIDPNLYRNRE